jgi:uncharacterized protein (TIGR03067 family)
MAARILLASLIGWAVLPLLRADPPSDRKVTPAQARQRFYGVWVEEERVRAGKRTTDAFDLFGWDFGEREWSTWVRRGELSAAGSKHGVRVDAATDPMRFDLLAESGAIKPGIFKFDGDKLVIATPVHWAKERNLGKGEDHQARPTEFKSTKDNGVEVFILRRGSGYFAQD